MKTVPPTDTKEFLVDIRRDSRLVLESLDLTSRNLTLYLPEDTLSGNPRGRGKGSLWIFQRWHLITHFYSTVSNLFMFSTFGDEFFRFGITFNQNKTIQNQTHRSWERHGDMMIPRQCCCCFFFDWKFQYHLLWKSWGHSVSSSLDWM